MDEIKGKSKTFSITLSGKLREKFDEVRKIKDWGNSQLALHAIKVGLEHPEKMTGEINEE